MTPARLCVASVVAVLWTPAAWAQISPGPLSRAHAKLEGGAQCLRCHDGGGVSPKKCLDCHQPLAKRIAAGKGLHARPEYGDCRRCHVEHHGADVELVWWGKQGRAAFDHAQTGHRLEGRHAALACERCHKPPSYLTASASCASCHKDEHRGQFSGRACNDCHGQLAWKPAGGFDHARTRWPLTGRHAGVGCERCHTQRLPDPAAPGSTHLSFRAVAGADCASCHRDAHQGRLGTACASCHGTAGWRTEMKRSGFDHSRTRYPLAGRHSQVACDRCHRPGQPLRVAHARCTDCHRDPHPGGAGATVESGRCERCHDVDGFRPARYGPDEHARAAYPLAGAHLAVACDACHKLPGAPRGSALPLRLSGRRCADCHRDPHRGELARIVGRGGCETCHRVESWTQVAFDHTLTKHPLTGRHTRVACRACHVREGSPGAGPVLRFVALSHSCESCHRDPHAGQFARAGQTACERCHTTDSMKATRFDHGRDAAWKLDGAHARLACGACHRSEVPAGGGAAIVRYKPRPTKCSGCHGGDRVPAKEGRS